MAAQIAACVYWPPFSRTPGSVALDVTRIECAIGRTADPAAGSAPYSTAHEARIDSAHGHAGRAPHCQSPTAPTSSAGSNRYGIRRCRRHPAASRRRSRRAGTNRHPSRGARRFWLSVSASRRAALRKGSSIPLSVLQPLRTAPRRNKGKSRATRSRPSPLSDQFMALFKSPIPSRQTACAEARPVDDGTHAMLVDSSGFRGRPGHRIQFIDGVHGAPIEERDRDVEHAQHLQ